MREGRAIDGERLPRLVEPQGDDERSLEALLEWLAAERAWLDAELLDVGGVLLRGFDVDSPVAFERVCRAVEPALIRYVGGESPRSHVSGDVYTSTEYAANLPIELHSEMSYAHTWPRRIFFACMQPAASGGETPIADTRAVLARIDRGVAERFARLGVTYVSRYHGGWGLGRSWQDAFETDDRDRVESILTADGVDFEWTDEGALATRSIRPGVVEHPCGDAVWFNQADRWHVTARGAKQAARLLRLLGEDGLPRHAYYGDGSVIDDGDLEHVREALRASERTFAWQAGDVLLLDNVLVAHGRRPFEGERLTLTAMG